MTQVVNHNDQVRRAAEYIQAIRAERGVSLASLLDEAGMRFNLTPLDAMTLERLFREEQKGAQPHNTPAEPAQAGSADAPANPARPARYVPACAGGRGDAV